MTPAATRTIRAARRSAMAALAVAALGLAACGGDTSAGEEDPAPDPEATAVDPSDEGGEEPNDPSDNGGEEPPGDETTDSEPSDEPADDIGESDRPFVMIPSDQRTGPGDDGAFLSAEDLADMLGEPFPDDATCFGDLPLTVGEMQDCEGPSNIEGEPEMVRWTARVIPAPHPDDPSGDPMLAVLFTAGEVDASADEALTDSTWVTGVGFGSAYGMEDITADELEEGAMTVLTSENAYFPIDDALPDDDAWASVSCSDGLSFDAFAAVGCTATTAAGEEWDLRVMPGPFMANDNGLLIGLTGPGGE